MQLGKKMNSNRKIAPGEAEAGYLSDKNSFHGEIGSVRE